MPQLLRLQHIGNQLKDIDEFEFNEEALAIAENLPQLRHLQLIGNQITDKVLKAILDGCTHLESLDLRWCLYLKLEGSLGKRCSEHIKDFKRPNDSIKDCEFIIDEISNDGYCSEFSLDDDDMLSMDYDYEYDDDYEFDDDDDGGGVDDDAD